MEHPAETRSQAPDVERLLKLKVPVIVKLAEKRITVSGALKFEIGTIIEFDKAADSELELMIRNKIIGYGEAVKVGENFGLRVHSICDVRETIQALGQ